VKFVHNDFFKACVVLGFAKAVAIDKYNNTNTIFLHPVYFEKVKVPHGKE